MLFFAVVAAEHSLFLVDGMEDGLHRLVVGYALWVVALHDAFQHVGGGGCFLFYNFIVAYDVEHNVWGYYA